MIVLIDADTIAYVASRMPVNIDPTKLASNTEQVEANIENYIANIFYYLESKYEVTTQFYGLFLGGESNFRKDIYPEYKAHRVSNKPPLLGYAKEYMIKHHNAWVQEGYEADDGLASMWNTLRYSLGNHNIVICSVDGDLKRIPCQYFDIHKNRMTLTVISIEQSDQNFYRAMLTGDRSDNVKGLRGIGEKKANNILSQPLPETAFREYKRVFKEDAQKVWDLNYRLLSLKTDLEIDLKHLNEL